MNKHSLNLELGPLESLEKFPLIARQDRNYGKGNDWFGRFRGGLYGMYARLHGVSSHFGSLHSWSHQPQLSVEVEYNLGGIFFKLDSALECFVFALNALGNSVAPEQFRDVSNERALRYMSPDDLSGAEILLMPEPKKPRNKDRPISHDQTAKLEPLAHRFVRFVNISAMRALEDSRRNFPLTHQDFVRAVPENA